MILDRNHWPWFGFVLVASAVAGGTVVLGVARMAG